MRNRWIALVVLMLFFFPAAQAQQQPETVLFSWFGSPALTQATQEGISAFVQSQRTKPVIQYRAVENRDHYASWLGEQWNSLNAGDLVELDAEMLRLMAKNETGMRRLADMEMFVNQVDLSQYSYLGLVGCLVDGILCAVPVSLSSHVFFWNVTALKSLKLSPPAGEAELFAMAANLRVAGFYPLAADAQSRMAMMVTYLQCRYGQPWVNEETQEVSFTQAQIIEGLQYLERLETNGVWPALSTQGNIVAGWRAGEYLGVWAWDSLAPELDAALPDKGKMELTTHLSGWTPYGGGFQKVNRMLAIPVGARNPQISAKLIHYLLSEEKGARALMDLRGIPISEGGAAACRRYRLMNTAHAEANKVALSWARYPMPTGFDAYGLVCEGGLYEQVLVGLSEGTLTKEVSAALLISGVKQALQ